MIVKNTAEIRKHLPVNISLSIENLKPFIEKAEEKYLITTLGEEQYVIVDDYAASNTKDADKDALLEKCIPPIVFLAIADGYDFLNVSFSDSGFHRSENETNKSLFGYQERNIKAYLRNAGFNGLDTLLNFLEDKIATYTTWAESEACTLAIDGLIRNAEEFTKYYVQLRSSGLVFRQIKSAMQRAEDFHIRTRIGNDLVDMLKELIQDRELDLETNNKYKLLLPYIQKPLAYLTIFEASDELGLKLTDRGLIFEEVTAGDDNVSDSSNTDKIEKIKRQAYTNGKRYTTLLVDYLNENTADFSELYTPISNIVTVADQSYKKTHTMF